MAKRQEYEYRADYKETIYVIRNGRFKKMSVNVKKNNFANATYWKKQKDFDANFGAKATMSSGTVYTSSGTEKLMMKYTVISPDGSTKYVREISTPTAYRTQKLLNM